MYTLEEIQEKIDVLEQEGQQRLSQLQIGDPLLQRIIASQAVWQDVWTTLKDGEMDEKPPKKVR